MNGVSGRLRAVLVSGGAIAAAFALTSSAPADDAGRGEPAPAKIKMVLGDAGPSFAGAASVDPGQQLKIINRTSPRQIGPHFFTIADAQDIPDTRQEFKDCDKLQGICLQLKQAHKIKLRNFEVQKRLVKKGAPGWDKEFTNSSKGDSWYTQKKGQSKTQVVSATPGSTLSFFCVIHRGMQGEIEVTSNP